MVISCVNILCVWLRPCVKHCDEMSFENEERERFCTPVYYKVLVLWTRML